MLNIRTLVLVWLLLSVNVSVGEEPFRRMVLPTPDSRPPGMETFAEMPLADLELLSREAMGPPRPFRLAEAHYRARLVDDGLIGTANWRLICPWSRGAVLDISRLRVALREATWENHEPALIRAVGETGVTLYVPPGERIRGLSLGWSVRGLPEPGELRFELELPASPVSILELELPADVTPTVSPADCLITPPTGKNNRTWRISIGERSQLSLSLVRGRALGRPKPLVVAREPSETRIDVEPAKIRCEFGLKFEVLHAPTDELTLEYDPSLTPTEVVLNNLASWEPLAVARGKPGRIRVRLRKPTRGGSLTVVAVCPLFQAGRPQGRWRCPWLRVVEGVEQGEVVQLQVHPDVRLDDWQPGRFQLDRSGPSRDGWMSLGLTAGFPTPEGATQTPPIERPSARPRLVRPAFEVESRTIWKLGTLGSELTTQYTIRPQGGPLQRLVIPIPVGWKVDGVTLDETREAAIWEVAGREQVTLTIDLPADQDRKKDLIPVTIRLNAPLSDQADRGRISFPDLTPKGATRINGSLSIDVSHAMETVAVGYGGTRTTTVDGPSFIMGAVLKGVRHLMATGMPAGQSFAFVHDGPLTGSLAWRHRRGRLSAGTQLRVSLVDQETTAEIPQSGPPVRIDARVQLDGESSVPEVILIASAPVSWVENWYTEDASNPVISVETLDAGIVPGWLGGLGTVNPIEAIASLAAAEHRATTWLRIRFARPLDGRAVLRGSYEPLLRRATSGAPELAAVVGTLPAVLTASSSEQPRTNLPTLRVLGVNNTPIRVESDLSPGWVIHPPSQEGFPWQLTQADTSVVPIGGRIDSTTLTTYLRDGRASLCYFQFRLVGSGWTGVTISLPEGAEPLGYAVKGRWGNDWPTSETIPVDPAFMNQTVEVVYRLTSSPGWLLREVRSPLPGLPITPPTVRRTWCLPPDRVPFVGTHRTPQPGLAALPRKWSEPWRFLRPEVRSIQESTLPLSMSRGEPVILGSGESINVFLTHLGRVDWIIDSTALREVGLHPNSAIEPGKPDRSIGLRQVWFGDVPVLTTERHRRLWKNRKLTEEIGEAVNRAVHMGRDPTGRFRRVNDWVRTSGSEEGTPSELNQALNEITLADWGIWQEWSPTDDPGVIQVLNLSHSRGLSWAWALIGTCIASWFIGKRWSIKWWFLGSWILVAGIAWFWLPDVIRSMALIPLATSLIVTAGAVLFRMTPGSTPLPTSPSPLGSTKLHPRRPGSSLASRVAPLLTLGAFLGLTAAAQPPMPWTVYLVPGPPDDPTPRQVFVPVPLLEHIQERAAESRGDAGTPVIRSAVYEGTAEGDLAQFTAEFAVRCRSSGPLVVPLTGIRLRETTVDGEPAYPRSLPGPESGYELDLTPGELQDRLVTFHFDVPIRRIGDDLELNFGIERIPTSSLLFHAPAMAEQLELWDWRGTRSLSSTNDAPVLRADLGIANRLRLSWRQPAAPGAIAQVSATEYHYWQVHPGRATLTSTFAFRVGPGSVSTLRVAIPSNLRVGRLQLRVDEPGPAIRTGIKSWVLGSAGKDGRQPLRIDLQTPLTGEALLSIDLFPKTPLTEPLNLETPNALQVADTRRYAAVRSTGISIDSVDAGNADEIEPMTFLQRYRRSSFALANLPVPDLAFRWPSDSPPAILRPTLSTGAPTLHCEHQIDWRFSPEQTEIVGHSIWSRTNQEVAPMTFVEWEVPAGIKLTEVRGSDIHTWTHSDGRVQVWLTQATSRVELDWLGRISLNVAAPFDLPVIGTGIATTATTQLRLETMPGWVLEVLSHEGLQEIPAGRKSRARVFYSDDSTYTIKTRIDPPVETGTVTLVENLASGPEGLALSGDLTAQFPPGRAHELIVTVETDAPPGGAEWNLLADLRPDAPEGCRVVELDQPDRSHARRVWVIRFPSGGAHVWQVTWASPTVDIDRSQLRVPRFQVARAAGSLPRPTDRVVLSGSGVRPLRWTGLQRTSADVWQVRSPEWELLCAASRPELSGETLHLSRTEMELGRLPWEWVGRKTFHLRREGGRIPILEFPQTSKPVWVAIDGEPIRVQSRRVPLAILDGEHTVQAVWTTEPTSETPKGPQIESGPLIIRADEEISTVYISDRYRLIPTIKDMVPPASTPWPTSPYDDVFAVGVPLSWTGEASRQVVPSASPSPPFGRTALLVGLVATLIGLSTGTGRQTRPEQFALVGGIAVVLFGLSTGWIFLVLPVAALMFRIGWGIWMAMRFVYRQATSM